MELTTKNFDAEVLESKQPVLVDFWASWCPPCKMVDPILKKLAKEFEGRVKIAKINVDKNPSISNRFDISGVPTFILFRNGEIVNQAVGARTDTQLRELMESGVE